jgi:radical SAM superfamily enzyme YgiQ (UPF0313 family)
VLKRIKKATTTEKIKENIALIHSHGIPVAAYFILGLPGETPEDMEKTIRFARESKVEWAQFACYLPIPGSPDGDRFLESCDLAENGWRSFHNTACPAPPESVTAVELKKMQRRAFLRFYLRPGPALRTLKLLFHRETFSRIFSRGITYLFGNGSS